MKRNRIFTNKYLLLAVVLIAMLALSGCRTRITNNSEVSNVKYDEDGFLSETYQMRRDELGLSIAEKPLLPDLGSPEEEEESEPEVTENLNVVQEEDTYVEPPTTTEAQNNANANRTTTTTRRPSRRDDDDDAEKVNIIFDANSGTIDGKPVLPIEVKAGSTYNTPPTPTREGYTTFTGWYTEQQEGKGEKVSFPCKVDEDLYLYAHWGDITVIFDANEGKVEGQDKFTASFKKGSGLKFPKEPTLKNNTFKGWHTDKEKDSPVKEGTPVNKNVTYYAHWEGSNNKVTITFHGNGGTVDGETMVSRTVDKGKKVQVPTKLVHPKGREFLGWSEIGKATEVVAESTKTYNAQWEDEGETFVVIFDAKGGAFDDNKTTREVEVKKGEAAIAPKDPKREGYEFKEWEGDFSKVQSNLTVTAKWTEEYTVTFDGNGGPGASEKKGKNGDAITMPVPNAKKDGYDFKGWSKSADGSDPLLQPGEEFIITEKTTFYAKWDPNENNYKYWDEEFEKASKPPKSKCYVTADEGASIVTASNAETISEDKIGEADFVIAYSKDGSDLNEIKEKAMGKPLLVLSTEAYSSNEFKTVYKILILKWLKDDTTLDYNDIARKLNLIRASDTIEPYYDSKTDN